MQVRNAKVKWASVLQPNTKYTPRWEICIYPTVEDINALEEAGLELKVDKETEEKFYRVTKNVTKRNGEQNLPPRVVDIHKNPFTELIGNGSICNVILSVVEVSVFGENKMKGYLDAVQVVKHVPYVGREDFDDVEDDEEF